MPWRAGRDETDFAMDYPDRNHCGGREMIHRQARKPITQAPEAPFTPTECPDCRSRHITVDQARA